jgi:hypothetical protein
MDERDNPHPDAQRVSNEMQKKRREEVERVSESNKQAHQTAKKQRQESDRLRTLSRGPNPR